MPSAQLEDEKHGGGHEAERLDAFADKFSEQISTHEEIQMSDGFTWWERTINIFGEIRDNVANWARQPI
jgi:hypothetical protein